MWGSSSWLLPLRHGVLLASAPDLRRGVAPLGCACARSQPPAFALYAEYNMQNAGLYEAQAGIKIARGNINNLRYADDTTLMEESEELKSLLMKVKEESEKPALKLNIQKTKIMASGPIILWQTVGEKVKNSNRFHFLGLQNHCGG